MNILVFGFPDFESVQHYTVVSFYKSSKQFKTSESPHASKVKSSSWVSQVSQSETQMHRNPSVYFELMPPGEPPQMKPSKQLNFGPFSCL